MNKYCVTSSGLIAKDVDGRGGEYVLRTLEQYLGTKVHMLIDDNDVTFIFTAEEYPTREAMQVHAFLRGWAMRTCFMD